MPAPVTRPPVQVEAVPATPPPVFLEGTPAATTTAKVVAMPGTPPPAYASPQPAVTSPPPQGQNAGQRALYCVPGKASNKHLSRCGGKCPALFFSTPPLLEYTVAQQNHYGGQRHPVPINVFCATEHAPFLCPRDDSVQRPQAQARRSFALMSFVVSFRVLFLGRHAIPSAVHRNESD